MISVKKYLLLSTVAAGLAMASPVLSVAVPSQLAQFSGEEQTRIDIYRQASPAVVTIQAGRGSGSGSIVRTDGLVLTNEHVVSGARGGQVEVRTAQGTRYRGRVIATDRRNDLALIRLETSDRLPTIPLGDRHSIQVGQQVYAIGSPFGLSGTITTGILSRIDRETGDLQTDAALNPGNSGGPLLNSRGQLIGVNKAILSRDGTNSGIGFATNVVIAQEFILAQGNRPTAPWPDDSVARRDPRPLPGDRSLDSRPRLGVTVDERLVVLDVERGSVAAEIGFRPGDRLLAINHNRLRSINDLIGFLETRPQSMLLTVRRNRRIAEVLVEF